MGRSNKIEDAMAKQTTSNNSGCSATASNSIVNRNLAFNNLHTNSSSSTTSSTNASSTNASSTNASSTNASTTNASATNASSTSTATSAFSSNNLLLAVNRQSNKRQHASSRKQAEYYNISEDKLHEYKDAFNMLDENCDGLISANEIKSMFSKIEQPVSDEEIQVMLKEIDLDGNEFIDLDEFIQMMTKYETRITPEQYEISLRRVFEIFDLDKNSFITKTELKEVMAKLGEHLSDDEVADMIRVADEDGDGRINFNEFRTIMEFVKTGESSKMNAKHLNKRTNSSLNKSNVNSNKANVVNEKHAKKK